MSPKHEDDAEPGTGHPWLIAGAIAGLFVLIVLASIPWVLGYVARQPNIPPPPVVQEPGPLPVTAEELYKDFKANAVAADFRYKDRVLDVRGVVKNIGKDVRGDSYVTLQCGNEFSIDSVQCFFPQEGQLVRLRRGQPVTVRGRCRGQTFNILLDDCAIMDDGGPAP